jgi:UDP-N-acetylglucosamine transferase subunit ALG13
LEIEDITQVQAKIGDQVLTVKQVRDRLEQAKNKLEQEINECSIVVCRAGYTSLMDLTLLHKKAILIPTPGQWEQEYLATWNSKKNNFLFVNQHQLDLKENIAQLIAI